MSSITLISILESLKSLEKADTAIEVSKGIIEGQVKEIDTELEKLNSNSKSKVAEADVMKLEAKRANLKEVLSGLNSAKTLVKNFAVVERSIDTIIEGTVSIGDNAATCIVTKACTEFFYSFEDAYKEAIIMDAKNYDTYIASKNSKSSKGVEDAIIRLEEAVSDSEPF